MIEFSGLGIVTQLSEGAGHAVQLEVLELVEGGVLQHDVSLMEVMRATDIGVIDRRSVRSLTGCAAIEVVLEDGGNRGVRPCSDLQGPFTGGSSRSPPWVLARRRMPMQERKPCSG